jgi:hypothetical protein
LQRACHMAASFKLADLIISYHIYLKLYIGFLFFLSYYITRFFIKNPSD